jgi:hypothetical protein
MNPAEPSKERLRRQRARNLAVFLALAAFVVLLYAVTIVKIKLGYPP